MKSLKVILLVVVTLSLNNVFAAANCEANNPSGINNNSEKNRKFVASALGNNDETDQTYKGYRRSDNPKGTEGRP